MCTCVCVRAHACTFVHQMRSAHIELQIARALLQKKTFVCRALLQKCSFVCRALLHAGSNALESALLISTTRRCLPACLPACMHACMRAWYVCVHACVRGFVFLCLCIFLFLLRKSISSSCAVRMPNVAAFHLFVNPPLFPVIWMFLFLHRTKRRIRARGR